jgi:hypothetical protein
MKNPKTMKPKKQYRFFSNLLAARFPRYCLKNIEEKKITENGKQKKKHPRKKQTRSIEAICAFPNWIFICLHVIRVSF